MSDYTSEGAVPVEDAASAEPPTVDEVLDEQRRHYPDQYRTNLGVVRSGLEADELREADEPPEA